MSVLVLEADTISALLRNNALTAAFPFLRRKSPASDCCGGGTAGADANQIKMAVAGLSAEQRQRFKEVLGVTKVRVTYHAAGKLVTVNF